MPCEGSTFDEIEDIGCADDNVFLANAKVAAATTTDYHGCLAYSSKLQPLDDVISQGTKCQMEQLTLSSKQNTSANLLLISAGDYIQLSAFQDVLHKIVQGTDITVPYLLTAAPLTTRMRTSLL